MESLEEVLRCLQAINKSMNFQPVVMQSTIRKRICEAGVLQVQNQSLVDDLKKNAELLDINERYGNIDDAEYYCFVPKFTNNNSSFSVYLLSANRDVITKLENYQNQILTSDKVIVNYAFIIPFS